ncbi:MAG: hypothetical protein ABI411_20845 [Tahibacter sp.]
MATAAHAQSPPVGQLWYSADVGASLLDAPGYVARSNYVGDGLGAHRVRFAIPGLPPRANLHDFQIDANGDVLFSLDVGVTLGGLYFDPADVIAYAGGVFVKAFNASAAGVPKGVRCDGVARSGNSGALWLSFDRTFKVGNVTIVPADVIAVSGAGFGAKVLDARALGLPAALNIDAIDSINSPTDLLVSFDTGGAIAGIAFADEDLLQLHLADSSWSKRFTLRTISARWAAANLDGLSTSPQSDVIFYNGFN